MGRLTSEQKLYYKENGFIVLKNIVSEEMLQKMTTEFDNLFKRPDDDQAEISWIGKRFENRFNNSDKTVKGIHNLQNHHAVFGQFMGNPVLLDYLEDIMGTKNIMLHYTKALFKPPRNGAEIPMHQDYPYFPYEKDTCVAAFLHLDASGPENGGLHVYPGSHKTGSQNVAIDENGYYKLDPEKFPFSKATPVIVDRGDIVVFSYLLIHGSIENTSNRPRRTFLVQYVSADDKLISKGANENQLYVPGYGWLFRGVNVQKDYQTANRFSPV